MDTFCMQPLLVIHFLFSISYRYLNLSRIEEEDNINNNNNNNHSPHKTTATTTTNIGEGGEEDNLHIENLTEEHIKRVAKLLEFNINYINEYENNLKHIITQYGRPSYLQANWMKLTTYTVGGICKYN